MDSTVNERIKMIADTYFEGNTSAMARSISVKQSTLRDIISNKVKPSYDTIYQIIEYSTIRFDSYWLLTGKGKMLKDDIHDSGLYPAKPFIDFAYATCGRPNGFSVAVKADECENVSLPLMSDYDFSIRAKGNSMINYKDPERSIKQGDFIACRLWKSRSHIRWGEVYALATSEGIVVKKLMPSEKEGHVKCVSFNEDEYPPYDLTFEEIYDWAIVVGAISVHKWG